MGDANRRITNEGANATVPNTLFLLYRFKQIEAFPKKNKYNNNKHLQISGLVGLQG